MSQRKPRHTPRAPPGATAGNSKLARRRIRPQPTGNLDLIAFALDALCPIDETPCFETLLRAIDEAEDLVPPPRRRPRKILRMPFNSLG